MRTARWTLGAALGGSVLAVAGLGYWALACNVLSNDHQISMCRYKSRHVHLRNWVLWAP